MQWQIAQYTSDGYRQPNEFLSYIAILTTSSGTKKLADIHKRDHKLKDQNYAWGQVVYVEFST